MSRLMLGTANFGNEYKGVFIGRDTAYKILKKAWELGIRDIDTARSYGESEQIIGEYIKFSGRKFRVWTKGRSEEDKEISEETLGLPPHAWLIHNYKKNDPYFPGCSGVSCYGDEWKYAAQELFYTKNEHYQYQYVQVPWNILDRRHSNTPHEARGVELGSIARSIFIRGEAFKMPYLAGVPFWHWCLQDVPDFDYIIVGVDSPHQLEEIVRVPQMEIQYSDKGVSWTETTQR